MRLARRQKLRNLRDIAAGTAILGLCALLLWAWIKPATQCLGV